MTAKWICSTMQIAPHVNWNKINYSYMCQDIFRQVSPLQQIKSSHSFDVSSTIRKKVLQSTLTGFCMEVPLWPRLKKKQKSAAAKVQLSLEIRGPLWEYMRCFWSSVLPSVDSIPTNANILWPGIVLICFPHFQKHKNRSGNPSYNKSGVCVILLTFHSFSFVERKQKPGTCTNIRKKKL